MNSDKPLLERLSQAKVSSDLSHRPTLCDVDFCAGSGAAAVHHRVGSALMNLDLTLERASIGPALAETTVIVRACAQKLGWSLTPIKTRRIAMEALRLYLRPTCEPCKGRGMLGVDRSEPDGRARPCPTCGGDGRAVPYRKSERYVRAVLAVMERARREFGGAVRKKMAMSGEVE